MNSDAAAHDGDTMLPELEWLHSELKLDDTQFAKVKDLHLAYRPTCEALCVKVKIARNKLKMLATKGDLTSPEFEAALQEQAAVQVECQKALLMHLHRTSEAMTLAQSQQYLHTMLPHVIGVAAEPAQHGH